MNNWSCECKIFVEVDHKPTNEICKKYFYMFTNTDMTAVQIFNVAYIYTYTYICLRVVYAQIWLIECIVVNLYPSLSSPEKLKPRKFFSKRLVAKTVQVSGEERAL
jgi:hypothetical protein